MNKESLDMCPCGSGNTYMKCCGQYISGEQIPATAEALMHSRYTAYTQANIPYIQGTMLESAKRFDPIAAEKWAKTAKWKRLKVIRAFSGAAVNTAYVEFMAHYIYEGKKQQLNEVSEFKQIEGRWYYMSDSQILNQF